ncbi:(-)-isopiperitenol/(-)-carveol dehydrogenase, mitochondrial-like [Olea europaea var. sylvestris]|uniref:(-)-isopiperitenol/(-)-carveol dehydrogenase, mitochondrial-like n=1 Tax=Olea europaea var. sylvestris TaxID=158386 RepID=UPI000C1CFF8E|nr:(-)-isopiperitenol/(-)-carveol dehydrogenase, mitochondrial-like [Olea europaea var. sylvestris]
MTDCESISISRKLQDKIAIVTGGASGIGEATARLFVEHGARAVVIADIQDETGQTVAESIGLDQCSYVHCDISNEEQVQAMADWVVQKYGQLDIMFSNAGTVSSSNQRILNLDFAEFDRVIQVNMRGMAVCVKHAARKMVEQKVRGAIVCTASVADTIGGLNHTDYTMSKHAVLGLVKSASQQLGVHGIRVNCVSPSSVLTPLTRKAGLVSAEDVEKLIGPLTSLKGVALTARHVAEAVLFLASEDSAFVTGHNLVVDGGLISLPSLNTS